MLAVDNISCIKQNKRQIEEQIAFQSHHFVKLMKQAIHAKLMFNFSGLSTNAMTRVHGSFWPRQFMAGPLRYTAISL